MNFHDPFKCAHKYSPRWGSGSALDQKCVRSICTHIILKDIFNILDQDNEKYRKDALKLEAGCQKVKTQSDRESQSQPFKIGDFLFLLEQMLDYKPTLAKLKTCFPEEPYKLQGDGNAIQ